MTYAPAGRGSDLCPVCGHPEDAHVSWPADETVDGWSHCTVGKDATACLCWRDWPRLPAESNDPGHEAFDRPPSTHDWRYVVRAVGRVLIATGLLLGGFVAYQLWGTGIEARRAQNALEDEFEALLATAAPTTSTTPTVSTVDEPLSTIPLDTVAETVPDTVATGVAQPIPPIVEGDAIARLEIPTIGLDVVVVAGVSVEDLRRGPGHYPETPLPGQFGNAAIAGHRTTYGQPFYDIDDLAAGDDIVVTTVAGRFVYDVTGTEIVEPDDTHVVATTNPDIAELTLTSCDPKWSASRRIIVHSVLVADESAPVGAATIGYGDGATPTTTTTSTAPTTTTGSTTSTTSPAPTTTASPPTSVGPSDGPTVTTPIADAFSDGWFHDRSAIPQVVIWAAIVSAIAVGAHLLSRRVHNKLIGIAAGIVPFLVTLYFFYQNLNRLLPPSL